MGVLAARTSSPPGRDSSATAAAPSSSPGRARCAWTSSARPRAFTTMPRAVRTNSSAPHSSSSCRICAVTAGCERCNARAAAETWPSVATTRNVSRRRGSRSVKGPEPAPARCSAQAQSQQGVDALRLALPSPPAMGYGSAMTTHKIAVIAGDGIGKEVVPEGIRVLDAAATKYGFSFERDAYPWSCEYYGKHGRMMPEDGLERIRRHDAIFLGAVGFPGVPDHVSLWGLLIPIRRQFQQYVNLRPVRLMEGVPSPLRDRKPGDIDFWVVDR